MHKNPIALLILGFRNNCCDLWKHLKIPNPVCHPSSPLPAPVGDKLKVLNTLIGQILTYASLRDTIDDNIEELKKVKNVLRVHQQTAGRHEKEIQAAKYVDCFLLLPCFILPSCFLPLLLLHNISV